MGKNLIVMSAICCMGVATANAQMPDFGGMLKKVVPKELQKPAQTDDQDQPAAAPSTPRGQSQYGAGTESTSNSAIQGEVLSVFAVKSEAEYCDKLRGSDLLKVTATYDMTFEDLLGRQVMRQGDNSIVSGQPMLASYLFQNIVDPKNLRAGNYEERGHYKEFKKGLGQTIESWINQCIAEHHDPDSLVRLRISDSDYQSKVQSTPGTVTRTVNADGTVSEQRQAGPLPKFKQVTLDENHVDGSWVLLAFATGTDPEKFVYNINKDVIDLARTKHEEAVAQAKADEAVLAARAAALAKEQKAQQEQQLANAKAAQAEQAARAKAEQDFMTHPPKDAPAGTCWVFAGFAMGDPATKATVDKLSQAEKFGLNGRYGGFMLHFMGSGAALVGKDMVATGRCPYTSVGLEGELACGKPPSKIKFLDYNTLVLVENLNVGPVGVVLGRSASMCL